MRLALADRSMFPSWTNPRMANGSSSGLISAPAAAASRRRLRRGGRSDSLVFFDRGHLVGDRQADLPALPPPRNVGSVDHCCLGLGGALGWLDLLDQSVQFSG